IPDIPVQLGEINARCEAHGIPKPISFAYPGNAFAKEALKSLRELGIIFARRGGSPEFPYKDGRGFAYEPGLDHPLLIPTTGDARPHWQRDDLKAAVAQAKNGKIAVLQFHGVPDTAHDWVSTRQEQFEAFLKYLADERYTDGSAHVEEVVEWQPGARLVLHLADFTPPLPRLAARFEEG